MLASRLARARWLAEEVLPHDRTMRGWFIRRGFTRDDIDEIMQETYFRMVSLPEVDRIENPAAYFFTVARNNASRRLKGASVVPLEMIAELEVLGEEELRRLETEVDGRLTLKKVQTIIASLPERCRRVVELRKIEGWSQKDIARHMNMTEKAVEKQIWLGVCAIRESWEAADARTINRLARLAQSSEKG